MHLPNKDEVKRHLNKIESDIYHIVSGAWKDWLESTESSRFRYTRTRANVVWDRMIDRAKDLFTDRPEIRTIDRYNQTASFVIDDSVLFRFKKGNSHGLSQNYPTQLALAFHDHDDPLLFDDCEYSRVEIVYILNDLETKVENIQVIARNKKEILWGYNVLKPQSNIEELPVKAHPQPASSLVRAKKQKEEVAEALTKN